MEINVNINCPDISFAAAALAKALSNLTPAAITAETNSTAESVTESAATPVARPAAPAHSPVNPTPEAPSSPTPATTTPAAVTTAPTAPAAVPTSPAPQITGDMVAKAGADLIAANPAVMGPLNALLQKYGVGCAQELKPDQIGPFATEMRALGAKI